MSDRLTAMVEVAERQKDNARDARRYRALRTLLDAAKWSDVPIPPATDDKYITPDSFDAAIDELVAPRDVRWECPECRAEHLIVEAEEGGFTCPCGYTP